MTMRQYSETIMKAVFFAAACVSIIAVLLICIFLFASGVPAMKEIGFADFLSGSSWKPGQGLYGIFPMIIGSIYVTAGAIIIGVPIGIFCAVYMAEYCPPGIYRFLKPAIELLAGIPSIVYGFFGLMVIVPIIQNTLGGSGKSLLAASVLLGIMILPTIIGIAESNIRAVPNQYYEGALALGASKERSIFKTVLPAAKMGILAGVVLGIGRAIGETMAVVMVCGNQAIMPSAVTDGVRTLTANIVLEMGYAAGLHREALIATAVVLFVFILIINITLSAIKGRSQQ